MDTKTVDVQDAEKCLKELLSYVRGGGEVVLTERDRPVARLSSPSPGRTQGRRSQLGALAHLGSAPSADDITEVRREMMAEFPRQDISR